MDIKELIKIFKNLNKSFYTKKELEIITKLSDEQLRSLIGKLLNFGIIEKIAKDIYAVFYSHYSIEDVASVLYLPNYLSFESALARYDILNQIPYTITFSTTKQSKNFIVSKRQVEFIQMPKDLFWGYIVSENIYIAEPEKAFLDLIYIASVKNYQIDMDEINLKKLSKRILLEYSRKFPAKIQKLII